MAKKEHEKRMEKKPLVVLLVDRKDMRSPVEAAIEAYLGKDGERYEHKGHITHYAPSPEQGLAKAREVEPELVILDPDPEGEGIEKFLKPFRQVNQGSVVICWSHGDYNAYLGQADIIIKKGGIELFKTLRDYGKSLSRQIEQAA